MENSDRELLELAAKAAGVPGDWDRFHQTYGNEWVEGIRVEGCPIYWNPLTDDGDALRLAVKLGMQIDTRDPETHIYANGAGERVDEYHAKGDALAATRRAIVRAAAEIAKGVAK